ncbi:MAG TPA: ABC transporter ATP-binding protein [Opitutaceae bacterium]|nr:ABC transporter ATP-binding protein [Lacunisphaera sp.]HWA11029.1 ABC transporter ATP-binding protein [Opitutaceae bacterium]
MNVIEIAGLKRRYGRTDAVHDLTLSVPEGGVFALLGPNGAGKSTTLKVLLNLLAPTAGSAHVLGVDSRRLSPAERRQIGYLSEGQRLPDWMTVRAFLDYCRGFYPAWDAALEKKLTADFELPPERKLKHLSRGMRVKAMLISVLSFRPRLLVLDEPFSGLDPVVRDEVSQGLLETARQGEWSVLMASHDIEEVERLADHIAVIDQGRLQLAESVESLLGRFRRVEVTLGSGDMHPEAAPADGWLQLERSGQRVRFVDARFSEEGSGRLCAACFPGATVSAQTMPLRDIYLAIARSGKTARTQAD